MARKARVVAVPAVLCSGALAIGLLVAPPAVAAPAPATPPASQADAPKVIDADLETPPELSVAAEWVTPGRAGGHGTFEIVFASTARKTKTVRELQVRVSVPDGTTVAKIAGKRWRCSVDSEEVTATCALRGDVGRDEDPPSITARLDIAPEFTSDGAQVRAWARWAGSSRDEGNWTVSDQGPVPVYPRATLDLVSNAKTVTAFRNGPRSSRQVMLSAAIGRLEGQYATLTWRQVSGPAVKFLLPRVVDGVSDEAQQVAEFTTVTARQRYVFAARVVAQGQVIERRIGVVVRGDELLEELEAAAPTEAAMAAATTLPRLRGALVIEGKRDLQIAGPLVAPAGTRVTLRADGDDAARGAVTWTVGDRRVGTGRTVDVSAPTGFGGALLVTARVRLPSGATARAQHVLVATERETTARAGVSPRDTSGFCRVIADIRKGQSTSADRNYSVTLGAEGIQRLSVPFSKATIDAEALDAQGRCTGSGGVDIVGAVIVQSERVRLAGVTARLSPTGLVVTSARVTVNSSLSNPLTDNFGLAAEGEFTARWRAGALGNIAGSATFTPLGDPPVNPAQLLLDIPGEWDYPVDGSRIAFADDLGVRLTQVVRAPPSSQGTRATVAFGIDISGTNPVGVDLTVANLALGETGRGGLISASGTGRFTLSNRAFQLRLPITCDGGWESKDCEIFGGLRFGSAAVEWSSEGISLDAKAAISVGMSKAYGVSFSGSYRAADDWDLSVSDAAPWDLGKGISLSALRGSIRARPAETESALTFSVTGTLAGLSLGDKVTVKRITPTLTNACPADDGDPSCSVEELKFFLDAEVAALLPGSENPTVFRARADVNLTTLDFVFTTGATDMEVGPKELRLTSVKLVISRGAPTPCVPQGDKATADDTGITVSFAGSARILSKDYTLNIQNDSRGLCIWGSGDTIDIGGGFRAVSPTVAFTTYPEGAIVNGDVTIEADRLIMRGGFVFPNDVDDRFQIPGAGVTFEADVSKDLKEAHFAVAYNADNEVTLYKGKGASLSLGQVGFAIDVRLDGDSAGFDGYFFGTGRLDIDGSAEVPASRMPLEVRIGVGYKVGESLRLQMTAGVPTGSVANAFGVEGLTVRRLSAGAAIDLILGAPSVAINADVTLPDGWGRAVGLLPGSPIALAVSLDAASPCLEFRVGSDGGEPVVDFGGKGFITGNYFRLLLAPTGCEVPDGRGKQKIAAGWAFSVQGALLGSPFEATSLLQIDSKGVRVDAVIQLPRLDLYGVVGFRGHGAGTGPRVSLNVDTERDVFDVSLDAEVEIGNVESGLGVLVGVKGDIRKAEDSFVIDLQGRAKTSLGPIRIEFDPLTIKGNIPVAGKESATNQLYVDISTGLSLTLDLKALGEYTVRGSGRLQMQDFLITQLALRASAEFDAVVYKVSGEVAVDLCLGTLSEVKADGTGSVCTLFPRASLAKSSPALRVAVTGTEFVPFTDPKPFAKTFYDREGVQK